MSDVYFVHHGQAGTLDAYDSLSDLGKRQSQLLGEYFVTRELRLAAAYVGGLWRQQQTADEVRAAYADAGVCFPVVIVDPSWDEFDLRQLDREIAPQLCAEDPEFRREYEAMRE